MNKRIIELLLKQRGIWLTFALLGAIFLFFQDEFAKGFQMNHTFFLFSRLYAFVFILIAVVLVLLDYLKGDRFVKKNTDDDYIRRTLYVNEELRLQLMELREAIFANNKITKESIEKSDKVVTLTESDKEKLFDIITKSVSQNINSEFLKSLDEKYSLKIIGEVKYKELLQNFDQTRVRVIKEIDSLSRRANLNLVIGSVTTIIAVGVLFTSVYGKDFSMIDAAKTLTYFIPRISTVIFIEVFSFFFLKLYRSNLNDIKYYQNEMTNIEFKVLSLKSALMTDDKEILKQIIFGINEIERNFILKRGETTVEIEAAKNQNSHDNSFADNFKKFADSFVRVRGKE